VFFFGFDWNEKNSGESSKQKRELKCLEETSDMTFPLLTQTIGQTTEDSCNKTEWMQGNVA